MRHFYQDLKWVSCILWLLIVQFAYSQEKQPAVKGIIKNEKAEPLEGVSVLIENRKTQFKKTALTDAAGTFIINELETAGSYNFTFTYVGYDKKVLTGYHYKKGEMITLAIRLDPANSAMEDVVIVGYGSTKKINLTGAVDQVSGEELENRSVPNLNQGLQGLIPNLNITMYDGKPIQAPTLNIRGNTSIGSGGSALVLIDGVEGDPSMINPNDVGSVTVLKDAASAAIYGARGAFGVVLISTKTPAKGKTSITYSSSYSIKKPTTVPDMVTNGYTFAKYFNEAWTAWNDYSQTPQNVNKTVKFSPAYLVELEKRDNDPGLPKVEVNSAGEYVYYDNTDWYGLLYKKHNSATEHNLSFTGSTDKTSFYATGRYYGQEGLFRFNSDDFRMYNLRAKGSMQVLPWLRIDNNTDYSNLNYHNPVNVGEGGGIWRNIADEGHMMAPLLNPDGFLSYSAAYTVGDFWYGKNGVDINKRIFKNTTAFTASFLKDKLKIRGDFTILNLDSNTTQIRVPVPYTIKPNVVQYVGTNTNDLQNHFRQTQYMATNLYGEYETRINAVHAVKAMAGFNFEQSTTRRSTTLRNGLIYENARDINLALGQSVTTFGGWDRWDIAGGFFRLNYGFRDRYLLEVDGRYDGSSKFPANERYAFFPSVSAGWRISNEAFWHVPRNIISDLKVRGSYGSLGNGNINSYAFQEQFNITQSSRILNGVKALYTNNPAVLPDGLTWETATTSDVGVDLALLSNRLTITGDYYVRNTTDMFTTGKTLPAVFGATVPKGNYADMKTTGWELSVNWHDKRTLAGKPFTYGAKLVLGDYTSKITRYNNPTKLLSDYYVGQRLGEIWGYTTEGFFTKENLDQAKKQALIKSSNGGNILPGDIKFVDINNDGVIDFGGNRADSSGDLRIIGNALPRYSFGVALDAGWNGFFIAAFFQGVLKQDWWPGAESDVFWGMYNRPYNKIPKSHLGKIWTEDNPNAYFPRLRGYSAQAGGRELYVAQTKYLQNVAYIRLKNIQVGYNLPLHLIQKIKMSNARVYVSGENLWSWTPFYRITRDLDVENIRRSDVITNPPSNAADFNNNNSGNGNNYPILKTVTFGLSMTF